MPDNPSATYRGYRKQALYALWRILTDSDCDSQSYRPEGEEDLAVFDSAGRLVEAAQVKDYTLPLTLSDFKPHSPDGYFARMKRRKSEYPSCRHSLVTFGPLGVELDGAIVDSGNYRNTVARKLNEKNPSISPAEAMHLLEALNGNVSRQDESKLKTDALTAITGTIAGAQGDVALELLQYWIFDASEHLRTITRSSLLQQLQRIGDYLAALRDHTTEWMVAVRPLEATELSAEEIESLRQEYRRGVQARWKHILANADCPRPTRLSELHEKVSRHSAVVVRGASGQGKSSLALRYLNDYCAEGLRFHVRFVDGREHAIRIANALRGHVGRLRLRAVVLLDLAPSDSGWVELVREMIDVGLKVIVTVREEDFRRSGTFAPDIDYAELVLDSITREEAESIYGTLIIGDHAASILDFDEVWARFVTSEGCPLLEFTHLVSEGETLTQKIDGQISRLQREASSSGSSSGFTCAHLQLLAIAALANAVECRVKLGALCIAVGLDPLTHPLQVLENEYLVRQRGTGSETTIGGLHSLRSQAIEAALLRDCPEMWGGLAVRCLPLVVDEDIERFLLSAFSRRPEHNATLEVALRDLPLRTWTHAGGIGRALLWEGMNRYEHENHETIAALIAEHSNAWWMLCDPYLALDSSFAEDLRNSFAEILKKEIPTIPLTEKKRVFIPLSDWAACVQPPTTLPATANDWILAGDLAFWLGKKKIEVPLTNALQQLLPEPLPEHLSIAELAQFISGRHALGDTQFIEWHDRHEVELVRRFVCETKSIHVTDDGEEVKVFFPVIFADATSGTEPDAHDLHAQTIKRVQLLRELYPHRQKFGSKGLGMEVLEALVPYDETIKSIPAENLPPERAIQLNAAFRNLVSYRLQRAISWRAYAETAFAFRRTVCDCFRELQRVWGRFFEETEIKAKTLRQMPGTELDRIKALSNLPMFPRTAVDEWGFVSEDQGKMKNTEGGRSELWGNLGRFKLWKKAWQEYESGVGQVAHRALEETLHHLSLKNCIPSVPIDPSSGRLLVINLGSAWEALADMQTEFRRWFARYLPSQNLAELEQHEYSTFRHLWAVAFNFVHEPLQNVSGGAGFFERVMDQKRREFIRHLEDELTTVMSGIGTIRVSEGPHSIDGKRSLLVACNHVSLITIESLRPQVVLAIWRAAHAPGWRNLEWTPISIEWQSIFVTHILRGKGLFPGGTQLNSYVLFGTESDFQVQNHHVMELPIQSSDYRALGLELWDTPLLSTALNFQGGFFAFIITLSRFYSLFMVASEQGLSDVTLNPCLEAFSQEISTLRGNALAASEDILSLMRIHPSAQGSKVNELMNRLERICSDCLFSVDTEMIAPITITLDDFMDWVDRLAKSIEESKTLLSDIMEFAIAESFK